MKTLESINDKKFQKLSKEELDNIIGGQFLGCGFDVMYGNQTMASVGGTSVTGDYGHWEVFGIRVSGGIFRANDEVSCDDRSLNGCPTGN